MPKYQLERPWFNGVVLLKRGAVVELPEGVKAPSTAILQEALEEAQPELQLEPVKSALPPPPARPVAKAKP